MFSSIDYYQYQPSMYFDPYTDVQIDRLHLGKPVLKALLRKLLRKVRGPSKRIAPAVVYNGLVVFDRFDLYGEGIFYETEFYRALLLLGVTPCEHVFEFCAGPGYIGYSLLAYGFCQKLTLADVNPVAVEAARRTARYNGIEKLVNIYLSDGLKQIPENDKWDLVVSNPPVLSRSMEIGKKETIVTIDPGGAVHREFYLSVKRFMKPGGRVLLKEKPRTGSVDLFEPMVREGGGRVVATKLRTDFHGNPMGECYVLSEW